MKKSELLTIIRQVVREEVRRGIREILSESNGSAQKPTPPKKRKAPSKSQQSRSSQSSLKEILEETRQSLMDSDSGRIMMENVDQDTDEFPTVSFGSQDAQAFGATRKSGMGGKIKQQQMIPPDMRNVPVTKDVANALTRDYSSLIDAMDKKK